jgi:predicted protein tyrosine phosphatase
MKIIVFCRAGITRSAAMTRVLKERHAADTLPAGLERNGPELQELLCGWADRVLVMDARLLELVPMGCMKKVILTDVGPDVWENSSAPDLVNRCIVLAEACQKDGWRAGAKYSLRPKPAEVAKA